MRFSLVGRVFVVLTAALVGFVVVSQFRGEHRFSRQLQKAIEAGSTLLIEFAHPTREVEPFVSNSIHVSYNEVHPNRAMASVQVR